MLYAIYYLIQDILLRKGEDTKNFSLVRISGKDETSV